MKRLILFSAIFCGLAAITRAQITETKTKIEHHGFKKKVKGEGDTQKVLMSTSAHPAYVHHTAATKHHYTSTKRHMTAARHVVHMKAQHKHVAHYNSTNINHYKKIKRKHENGEYKVKYKT